MVNGMPGTELWMCHWAKNKEHAGERRVIVSADGQSAVSHFSRLELFAEASLMQVEIETGRTHQIRVHAKHCSHSGHW